MKLPSPQDITQLVERLFGKLEANQQNMATAESCTGGLIASHLTERSGSSAFFLGGIIAYSNKVKSQLLGVDEKSIMEHGAVSREVAAMMAESAQVKFEADFSIAVTGIAGPGGGTADKPVGSVWCGFATPGDLFTEFFHFEGNRQEVRLQTVYATLHSLCEYIDLGY